MDRIARQILQLKNELARQKSEQEKILGETQNLTREAEQEIAWLHAQRQKNAVMDSPQPPAAPTSQSGSVVQGGKYFGNGDRSPTTEELMRVWGTTQEVEIFAELQDWIDRDRAAQVAQPSTERKWFGGDRTPTMEEMLDQKNFDEMLAELEES